MAGQNIRWLRDNLNFFKEAKDVGENEKFTSNEFLSRERALKLISLSEEYAHQVEDTGGVYFVPAFSGLLAPHWQPDARG